MLAAGTARLTAFADVCEFANKLRWRIGDTLGIGITTGELKYGGSCLASRCSACGRIVAIDCVRRAVDNPDIVGRSGSDGNSGRVSIS